MTDNITLVQELKCYLHESTPNFDNSIDVKFSDFSEEYDEVLIALTVLQNRGHLRIIGIMGAPGVHMEEKCYDLREFKRKYPPEYAKVVMVKHYGKIDEKFELRWDSVGKEVWAGKVFIKGFSLRGEAYMNAFVHTYENSGISLVAKDFYSVLGTPEIPRLDTMITVALDTLSRNSIKWWYRELGSKRVRCERIYWKSEEEEPVFVKQPKHYELDPFERGEWSA